MGRVHRPGQYLSQHRGEYAERGAVFLPMVFRADLSVSQDIFATISGQAHTLQFRIDITNFTNMLNHDWGVGQRCVEPAADEPRRRRHGAGDVPAGGRQQPVAEHVVPADGRANFDVYRVMFSFRYFFN